MMGNKITLKEMFLHEVLGEPEGRPDGRKPVPPDYDEKTDQHRIKKESTSGFFGGDEPHPVKRGIGTSKRKKSVGSWAGRASQRIPTGKGFGDCPSCRGYGTIMTGKEGQNAVCPECDGTGGNLVDDGFNEQDENEQDWCEVCNQPGGNPDCKYCRDAEKEAGRNEYMNDVRESHGEREAGKRGPRKGPTEKDREYRARSTREPQIDDPGFAGKDPKDRMFFGDTTGADFLKGGRRDDPALDVDLEPTELPGGHIEDFGEPEEEPGFGPQMGTGVDPNDLPLDWGPEGHQDAPGSDVRFSDYDEDEPPTDPSAGWWRDREKAKKSDDRFQNIRRMRGDKTPAGLEPRRRPIDEEDVDEGWKSALAGLGAAAALTAGTMGGIEGAYDKGADEASNYNQIMSYAKDIRYTHPSQYKALMNLVQKPGKISDEKAALKIINSVEQGR